MAAPRPVLHLIDGHVLIFRAYYSLPAMEAPDGTATGAAYGFANTLLRWLGGPDLRHVVVCFDYAMESFRNERYPAYKAQRGEPPADLEPQFALCQELTEALGVPSVALAGFEADDLIATLCERATERGGRAVVVTSDKDLSQLVRKDDRVVLHDPGNETRLDAAGVRAKFGVDPDQIPDYLALVGDTVDNLPGVPGVGPKSAAALLGVFRDAASIPADPSAWDGVPVRGAARLAAAIEAHREQIVLVRELATVRRDVPGLPEPWEALEVAGADRAQALALFDRLGWGRIRERVPRWRN